MQIVKKIAMLGKDDREVLFSRTAEKMNMNPSIIEKDFWVCFMLDHLLFPKNAFLLILGNRNAIM